MFQRVFQLIFSRKNISLKQITAANFAGSIWSALISIIFVPLYLRYLGVEAYGIIGVFNSLQIFAWLFDFGLSATHTRELAALSAFPDKAQEMRNLTRTLEIVSWLTTIPIAVFLISLSFVVANYWVQPGKLSVNTVFISLVIMSISAALQFPGSFYTGGLTGLQKQPVTNLIGIFTATFRAVGSILIIIFVSPTIEAFLIWQTFVGALQLLTLGLFLWRSLKLTLTNTTFHRPVLNRVWRFAAGMTGLSFVSLFLTQIDKVILSRMLPLENFGYYTLATTISLLSLGMIAGSVTNAVYPKFSRLAALEDEEELKIAYHRSCQFMSVLLIPAAVILAAFSFEILRLWTHNEVIATNTYQLLALCAIGTGLNGLIYLPYHLQLAHGCTRLTIYTNIGFILTLIPLMIFGVINYGAIGGAAGWVILNIAYTFVMLLMTHRYFLKGERWRWYLEDVFPPLIASLTVVAIWKLCFTESDITVKILLELSIVSLLTYAAAAFSAKWVRQWITEFLQGIYTKITRNSIDHTKDEVTETS